MRPRSWIALVGFILLAQGAGIVGALFTTPSIPTWYATLVRPDLAPPNWVFGPVWTTLFLLMGIAAYLVWRKHAHTRRALGLFFLQLGLNVLWSFLFFGLHNPGAAFVEIILLWITIALTMRAFWHYSKVAVLLLLPYLAWVTFAGILNYFIWILN